MALREIYKYINFGLIYAVDADIQSYFDAIPHNNLLLSVKQNIHDKSVIKLIEKWLKVGVMEDMKVNRSIAGTPQGGVISPLLSNIYLHWLDSIWENRGYNKYGVQLVRYADDFVILCSHSPKKYLHEVKLILNKLGLKLNEDKTKIVKLTHGTLDFLGHRFVKQQSKKSGKVSCFYYPTPIAMKSIRKKIGEVVRKSQHMPLPVLIQSKLNPILRGWSNYFKTGNSRKHFQAIDSYTRLVLCIMLRKKYKKSGKGWREHPPTWFHDYHRLYYLNRQVVNMKYRSRYAR